MDNLQLINKRLERCVTLAKSAVIASFNDDLKETRQKAVDAFWATKELQELLSALQSQLAVWQQLRTGDD